MFKKISLAITFGAALTLAAAGANAAPISLDTADSSNGLTDIYSATFDGALTPCGGGSPSYCSFFGGQPGVARNITISPNPSGLTTGVPGGFTVPPAAGSFLDLTRDAGNTQLTLAGGTIIFPTLTLNINGSALGAGTAVVTASNAGMVFDPGQQTVALNSEGQAEFLVNLSPALAADFSTFSNVVTNCVPTPAQSPLCGLITVLSLDMVRYRLFIDYSPDFASFTGTFIGQTGNNSLVYANLNAVPAPAAAWLMIPAVGAALARARRRRKG